MTPADFIARVRRRIWVYWVLLTRRIVAERAGDERKAGLRVLYVANSYLPTLQLAFVKPLQALADAGEVATELLSQEQMEILWGRRVAGPRAARWVARRYDRFNPNVVVFCRYSGPHAQAIRQLAASRGVPTLYHIDDDLLDVPPEIGEAKFQYHNAPPRLQTVRWLLQNVDLVYCSTAALLDRLQSQGLALQGVAGHAHCASGVLAEPAAAQPVRIGYMGIDHAHDFAVALPALVDVLTQCPDVEFEIFGPMAVPAVLRRFGRRVRTHPPVASYPAFLEKLAGLSWGIGICPLADTPFNSLKSNNKWVEYTAAGTAVVATAGTIYDDCCAAGCGRLVKGEAQWREALLGLIRDPAARLEQVARAQDRLRREYSVEALRDQVLDIFATAGERTRRTCRKAEE